MHNLITNNLLGSAVHASSAHGASFKLGAVGFVFIQMSCKCNKTMDMSQKSMQNRGCVHKRASKKAFSLNQKNLLDI